MGWSRAIGVRRTGGTRVPAGQMDTRVRNERPMRVTIFAAVPVLMAAPALAGQCPLDISRIDATLKAGRHGRSVERLAEAKAILGID